MKLFVETKTIDLFERFSRLFESITAETKLRLPVMKIKNFYYVTPSLKFEMMELIFFEDGILMPHELYKNSRNILYVITKTDILNYPYIFTKYDKEGFGIVYDLDKSVDVRVVTSSKKWLVALSSYFYPNIKDLYNLFIEARKSRNAGSSNKKTDTKS